MQHKIKSAALMILIITGIGAVVYSILLVITHVIDFGVLFTFLGGIVLITVCSWELFSKNGFFLFRYKILRNIILFFVILGAVSFIFIESLLVIGGVSDPITKTGCLIVLGTGLYGDQLSPALRERMDKALWYLEQHPSATVVVSGGQGYGETISEAEAMKRYLVQNGIDEKRIIKEDRSTSTMENFKYSKEVLMKKGIIENSITIVTNDFHMYRSKMLAERNGFDAYALTSETPAFILPNCYIREYFAFVKSFFVDR